MGALEGGAPFCIHQCFPNTDHLGKRSLYPVEEVLIRRGVLFQGKGAHKELRGNLGDGRPCPQLVQRPNNIRGGEAGSPCANLTGAVIRLRRGLLAKVVQFVFFRGDTGKGVIRLCPRGTEERLSRREVEWCNFNVGRRPLIQEQPQDNPKVWFRVVSHRDVEQNV